MKTFAIPSYNIENLEKKLARIQKKAKKYGCDFTYNRIGTHFEKRKIREQIGFDTANVCPIYKTYTVNIEYIDIEVDGTAKVDGWEYVATLDYQTTGNIISGTGKVDIPKKYYSCTPWCEHCKTERDRKSSYIVWNEESGDFRQVGRNCLKDFTGGLSAEAVSAYESAIHEAEEASEFSGSSWGWNHLYFDTIPFLTAVCETIRIYGYVKRGTPGTECTADRVVDLYKVATGMRLSTFEDVRYAQIRHHKDAVSKGWDMKNPESIARATAVRDWIVNNERDDNYYHNLKVVCALDCVDEGKTGLLASAFPAYDRELEYQAEKLRREIKDREAGASSQYIGSVGDRITITITECKALTSWETQWGTTTIYRFVDASGNHIIWKTSKWIDSEKVVGKTITGTVKDHRDFRDVHQTELTRCKIA